MAAPIKVPMSMADIEGHMEYKDGMNSSPASIHNGQRKLLLSHLLFLTEAVDTLTEEYIVVYAGAAPGTYINKLRILFPNIKFVLFDNEAFKVDNAVYITGGIIDLVPVIDADKSIFIFNRYFTDTDAENIYNIFTVHGRKVLFISDIRPLYSDDKFPTDHDVLSGMCLQYVWMQKIQPTATSLKIRQPFYRDNTVAVGKFAKYFANAKQYGIDFVSDYYKKILTYPIGTYNLQPWSAKNSTETRLNILYGKTGLETTSVIKYEQAMCHYNNFERPRIRMITNKKGDQALEDEIVCRYSTKFNNLSFSTVSAILKP